MSNLAIKIENVSKKYMISHRQAPQYESLREHIMDSLGTVFKRNIRARKKTFWSLKDINLDIEQGDRIALVGPNGAGKSTLLKILSQVTEPTTGQITLQGKISSLLEVGTGFHPELTGRENIFLNGSIMGMSKRDINRQLDEIVEFSGVEEFLDTPIKRYSSGMHARLGFAVAAHLQSDILIVDEVLAVGDAAFQKKCLGKMDEVSRNTGKTILFVSHNLHAVKTLCNKGVLLYKGRLKQYGDIRLICDQYAKDTLSQSEYHYKQQSNDLKLCSVEAPATLNCGDDWEIKLHFDALTSLKAINVDFSLYNRDVLPIFHVRGSDLQKNVDVNKGGFSIHLLTKNVALNNGEYLLGVYVTESSGRVLLDVLNIPAGTMQNAPSYVTRAALISNEAHINFHEK